MLDRVALGEQLRAEREHRGLSVAQLAAASSVSASMLSAVERGEKAPTVPVLAKIADGLGLTLRGLLETVEPDRAVLRRRAHHDTVDEPGGWQRTVISPAVPGVNFEWVEVTLPPGCAPAAYPAYAAGSHEFLHVRNGQLTVDLAQTTYRLERGDTLYFPADTDHAYRNQTGRACSYSVAAIVLRARTPRTDQR